MRSAARRRFHIDLYSFRCGSQIPITKPPKRAANTNRVSSRNMRKTARLVVPMLFVILLISVAGCWIHGRQKLSARPNLQSAVPYTIIYDRMDTIIKIGVPASIDEKQLRATLVKAANDHQDDDAR